MINPELYERLNFHSGPKFPAAPFESDGFESDGQRI